MKGGGVTQVQFRIVGDDDRIPKLGGLAAGVVDGMVLKGQRQAGREAPHHFMSMRIAEGEEDAEGVSRKVTDWLRRHQSLLASLAGDKWIEFSATLVPEQAYETIAFPEELLQAALETRCRLLSTCYAGWDRHDSMWKRYVGE